jgi:hypothetical protein
MATSPALAPYGFNPSTIGLPGERIDYCVTPRKARKADLSDFVLEKVLRLSKPAESLSEEHTLKLTIDMEGTDIANATWTIDASSVPFWLTPSIGAELSLSGVIGALNQTGTLTLTANTAGVPESFISPYTAPLNVSVVSQLNQSFLVLVQLYVRASTLANTSIWGHVSGPATGSTSAERACHVGAAETDDDPIEVVLGEVVTVPFTACDSEGLAVDHDDGDIFSAVLIDRSSGTHDFLNIAYTLFGTHNILVRSDLLAGRRLGEFGLQLNFTAGGGTPEQVGVERVVRAVCPRGQMELSDGIACGCEAGKYLYEISPNVLTCKLCEVGRYCSEGAAIGGSPCPTGFTTDGLGAKSSDECGCREGTYESTAAGADITRAVQ